MTLRRYGAAKVSTTSKFSASANNFRAIARQKVSVNILVAGEPPPPPPVYLWGWGYNSTGQLGLGNTTNYSSRVQIGALTTWSKIDLMSFSSIAIKTDGTLWTWGNNGYGRLGLGNTTGYSSPKQVGALTTWSNISGGGFGHVMVIKTDGTMWSWGYNAQGQLGLENTTNYSSPKQIGSDTWSSVSCGYDHNLAIKPNGTMWSWGQFGNGGLGLGGSFQHRSSPTQIGALTTWSKISADGSSSMAIKTDGTMWSWGNNDNGRLGLGDTTNQSSPVQIGALTTWSSVSCGGYTGFAAAIKTDGTLWSWGYNIFGQLGLGNETNQSSPVQIGALTTWSSVSSKGYRAHAIKTDGTLWSWGFGNNGRLGLGNTTYYSSPKQVGSSTNWRSVSAGIQGATLALG